jgi:outer membrane protein assembly factor BamB
VLTVLEARSGERRWSDPVATTLTKFVGTIRDGKRLIVSSQSQAFFYDVETGALQDKQKLAHVVGTRPVQVGPILVYGCTNGQVLGHLLLNGFKQWGSFLNGAIETDPVAMGDTGLVGIVSSAGDVLILNAAAGGQAQGRSSMYAGTDVPLAASDVMLFVASKDHSLYGFSAEGAGQIWRKRTDAPLKFAPMFFDGKVYCDMGDAGLTCFEAVTGKEVWSDKNVHGTVVAMHNKRLLAWDGATATLVDPADGARVDSANLQNVSIIKTDKFVDGNVYLAAPMGVVTKLVPK